MMDKDKVNIIIAIILTLSMILLLPFISAVSPFQQSESGLYIQVTLSDYIETSNSYIVSMHVFNYTDGLPMINGVSCYLDIYNGTGGEIYDAENDTASTGFDFSFTIDGGNFTDTGDYFMIAQCNTSTIGGFLSEQFYVNDYGDELTEGKAINFNWAMLFLMLLFLVSLVGLFTVNDYKGKFALYWVCHVLFIVGTFSVWQFNEGYSIQYIGLASIFKVMFYVSIFSLFPMVILSLSWIFYMHLMSEEIKGFMNKGMDEDEAFKRARRNRKW